MELEPRRSGWLGPPGAFRCWQQTSGTPRTVEISDRVAVPEREFTSRCSSFPPPPQAAPVIMGETSGFVAKPTGVQPDQDALCAWPQPAARADQSKPPLTRSARAAEKVSVPVGDVLHAADMEQLRAGCVDRQPGVIRCREITMAWGKFVAAAKLKPTGVRCASTGTVQDVGVAAGVPARACFLHCRRGI